MRALFTFSAPSLALLALVARKRDMLGAVVLLTTPGVPMLFQGEEFLATGTFKSPPAPLGTPTAAGAEVRAFYKYLIPLRRAVAGFASANVTVFHRNDAAKSSPTSATAPSWS